MNHRIFLSLLALASTLQAQLADQATPVSAIKVKAGFKVEQNPPPKANGKKPDYKIEGEYADNIAPQSSNPRTIADRVAEKAGEGQADRIVVNMTDSKAQLPSIKQALHDAYNTPGSGVQKVKEVIIIQDGAIQQWTPPFQ